MDMISLDAAERFFAAVTGPGWLIYDKRTGESTGFALTRREARGAIAAEIEVNGGWWDDYFVVKVRGRK